MRILQVSLSLLALCLVGLPASGATNTESEATRDDSTGAACVTSAANPPCGYIMPYMDTSFEGKERCGTAFGGDPTGCPLLMAKGESRTYNGTLVWWWDVTQDGIYPPSEDIVISFAGTGTNPTWMDFTIDPEQFVIAATDFGSPDYLKPDTTDPANPKVIFRYEKPVTVTITRTGDPSEAELEQLFNKGGLVQFSV
jgi:hypothetical protein